MQLKYEQWNKYVWLYNEKPFISKIRIELSCFLTWPGKPYPALLFTKPDQDKPVKLLYKND